MNRAPVLKSLVAGRGRTQDNQENHKYVQQLFPKGEQKGEFFNSPADRCEVRLHLCTGILFLPVMSWKVRQKQVQQKKSRQQQWWWSWVRKGPSPSRMIYAVTRGHAVRHGGQEEEVECLPNRYIHTALKKEERNHRVRIHSKQKKHIQDTRLGFSVSVPLQGCMALVRLSWSHKYQLCKCQSSWPRASNRNVLVCFIITLIL